MSIEKLERVMWRVRANNPGRDTVLNSELERAIMYEIGTDPRTYRTNRKRLVKLGWVKSIGNKKIWLSGKDITG